MKPQKQLSRRKQAFYFSLLCVIVLVSACSKVLHWSKADATVFSVDSSAVDPEVAQLIAPYQEELRDEMGEVIGHNANALQKERPEGSLNNWVADVVHIESEKVAGVPVDFFVSNFGGIRINTLPAGNVTVGSIYELMPFDNQLVLLQVPGDTLQKLLDLAALSGGWAISKELRMTIDGEKAINVSVHGLPMNRSEVYSVALSDYLANGGDNCTFLKSLPRRNFDVRIRDVLIGHVRNLTASGKMIEATKDGRVRLSGMH